MGRFTPSLRGRLLLLIFLAVLPAFGVIGYSTLIERQRAAEDAKEEARTVVRSLAREQGRLIDLTRQLLLSLAQSPLVMPNTQSDACNRRLVEIQKSYPYYANVGVALADGSIFCHTNYANLKKTSNISDRTYFQRAVRQRGFSIGDYQIGRVSGQPVLGFGYAISDPEQNVQSVLFASLELSWFEKTVTQIALPAGSVAFVIDSSGTVLTHRPELVVAGFDARKVAVVRTILSWRREGTVEAEGVDGVNRLYAFAPLYESGVNNVYVAVGIPLETAFADSNRDFFRSIGLLLIAAVLTLVAAWFGGDAFVLKPVSALATAARRLTAGEMNARTGLAHGNDELGQIAGSFDEMAGTLQRTNRALKTLSAGSRAMARASDEQALLNEMCRVIVDVGGYRSASIFLAEKDEVKTVQPVAEAGFEGGMTELKQMMKGRTWADTELGSGAIGTSIRTGKYCVMRDISHNPRTLPWREESARRGYASVAAFPIIVQRETVGALAIYAPEADAFDDEEVGVLDQAATDLAFGIDSLRTRVQSTRAQATIQHMSRFDRITGLPTHAQFQEDLRRTLSQFDTTRGALALVVLGLDRLHEINDALGFAQGDLLLKEVGTRIRAAAHTEAIVARMRGDEFAVLAPVRDATEAGDIARHVLSAFRAPFATGELEIAVTAAAGISLFPQHGSEATQLMRCADVAMRQAKKFGEDFVFYAVEQDAHSAKRLLLAGELKRAIESGELVLYYQPKLEIPSGRVCGIEALVRWKHPTRGMIFPDDFIELAEHTGLIKPLTDWVIGEALRQSALWRQQNITLPIAVNLSPRNLRDSELMDKIARLLAVHGTQAGQFEIEITEGAVMEDPASALAMLTRLSDMGIALFIDDFGTGYSSLSYLKKLPVDAVKIDKSFVMDMLTNNDSAAIVHSTIDLAHDLGLKVVAEGVENDAILRRLAARGCDVAQGYFFSKPVPADQFKTWLERHSATDEA